MAKADNNNMKNKIVSKFVTSFNLIQAILIWHGSTTW